MSRSSPATTAVEWLAIPKDDTAPHTPVVPFAQRDLEANHSDMTASTDLLGLGELGRSIREEPAVLAFRPTSALFLYLFQFFTHVESFLISYAAIKKAAGLVGGL
jgi:hypothetical protein